MKKFYEGRKPGKDRKTHHNVVSIFTGKPLDHLTVNPIIRIAPELDGLEMLYSNKTYPDKVFTLKICCWALYANGNVQGMVPWLNALMPCTEINDPLEGFWHGYRDPGNAQIFYQAPDYKIAELKTAAEHFSPNAPQDISVQLIPDHIGTHAAFTNKGTLTLTLSAIHSWKLRRDGKVVGMIADHHYRHNQSSLPGLGDTRLVEAHSHKEFRYFFQKHMAAKIRNQDPEAMAAISLLMD